MKAWDQMSDAEREIHVRANLKNGLLFTHESIFLLRLLDESRAHASFQQSQNPEQRLRADIFQGRLTLSQIQRVLEEFGVPDNKAIIAKDYKDHVTSLRDQFAMSALNGLVAALTVAESNYKGKELMESVAARGAYLYADAMLTERGIARVGK